MGKKVFKTVLKVAAVAAIAYFAPVIAAPLLKTVGVSGALAGTIGSAAIGAGLGELSGVGWRQGLMAGGLAGAGKAGLFSSTAKGATAAGGAGSAAGTAGTAAAGTAGTAGTTAGLLPTGGVLPTGVAATGGTATLTAAAPQTLGGALSAAASNPVRALGQGVSNIAGGVSAGLNTLGGAVGLAPGALGSMAPQLLAAGLVGGGSSGALAAGQEAELVRAQQMNAALTQQRLDEARKLIGEAEYFDPEYMGRQAAEAAMIRGGIQETEGTRGLTGERRAAEQRRYRLGTARTAGTAYQQGRGTGAETRTRVRAAGISAMPTEFPITNSSSALAMREAASQSRAGREAGLAALFAQAMGQPAPSSMLRPSVDATITNRSDIF